MNNTKFVLTIIALSYAIASCNDKAKKLEQDIKKKKTEHIYSKEDEINKEERYIIELVVQIDKADNFQLFYTVDYTLSFTEERVVTKYVPGLPESQSIIFELPINVSPDRYRFDVGSVREQRRLIIESLSIRNNKKEILIKSDLIQDYLEPNQFIKNKGAYYSLNTIKENGVQSYDPFFTCSPLLVRALNKIQ